MPEETGAGVLNFLRHNRGRFLSGEELSRRLKVSRSAVWKEMENLRVLGYEIEAKPHEGYRLIGIPDKMFGDEIACGLKTRWLGRRNLFAYQTLDSTNDAAARLGEESLEEGACVFAEFQKKGRGRLGRVWTAPRGENILFSTLLRPKLTPAEASKVTLMAAVSAVKAVRDMTGVVLGIKWPNDVVYRGKKVCGILTEMSAELDRVRYVVLGIGINVNSSSRHLPPGAVSLKEICGRRLCRLELAGQILNRLEEDYTLLKEGRFEELVHEWENFSVLSGKRVTVNLLERKVQGVVSGVDKEGALWIRADNGLQERVLSGDVQILRQSDG